jgi:hypothetical protein
MAATTNTLPGANNRLQIPTLENKDEFTRWFNAVLMLSQALAVKDYLTDERLDMTKVEAKRLPLVSQLVMAITNSLSSTLYDVAIGADEDASLIPPAVIIARLRAHFQPKYLFGDIHLRNKMHDLRYEDYNNLTEYILAVQKIAKQINEIERKKAECSKSITPSFVDDRQKIGTVTRRLPEDYKIQIDKIESDLEITFEKAVELLKRQEDKLKDAAGMDSSSSSSSSSTSINNLGTKNDKKKRRQQTPSNQRKCSVCGNLLPKDFEKRFHRCSRCQEKWKKENPRPPPKNARQEAGYQAYIAYIEACKTAGQQPAPPPSFSGNPFAEFMSDLNCLDFEEQSPDMADRNTDLNQMSGGIMAEELFKEGSNELPTISAKIQDEDNAYPFKFDQSLPDIPVPKQSDDKV